MPLKSAIADYAGAITATYATPIALDRLEPLVCMTVGAERIITLNRLYGRICNYLGCCGAHKEPTAGARMEALTGEFGSGKSHLGYMLKRNLLSSEEDVLLAHVQITGAARFQDCIAQILRSLQIARAPSYTINGTEISAYRQLFRWYGNSTQQLFQNIHESMGNLPESLAGPLVDAFARLSDSTPDAGPLQQFFNDWILARSPRDAIEVLLFILRLFARVRVNRCALIIDEFEAIQHLPESDRRAVLQAFQDLYDSLARQDAGSVSAYLVLLATDDWVAKVDMLLPSFGSGNRLRIVTPIPDLSELDIRALVYKNLYYHLLANADAPIVSEKEIDALCRSVIEASSGKRYHLRSIQRMIHDGLEALLFQTL